MHLKVHLLCNRPTPRKTLISKLIQKPHDLLLI